MISLIVGILILLLPFIGVFILGSASAGWKDTAIMLGVLIGALIVSAMLYAGASLVARGLPNIPGGG